MKTNKNYIATFLLLTIFSFSTTMSMQESNHQLPEGVSESYFEVIHTALENVGEPGSRPDFDKSKRPNSELVLGNRYLSHCISQYIPEKTIEDQQDFCAKAIKRNNYSEFKNSFEILKIY